LNRIDVVFRQLTKKGIPALIPFVTAGDPDMETTYGLVLEIGRRGADIIELGMPFSDPLADGPTIQAASQRALKQGVNLEGIFSLVEKLRCKTQIPLVLMGYYNPIYHFGLERFGVQAAKLGVDGVIIPDLPPEEATLWKRIADPLGLYTIFLVAPTSPPDRIEKIVKLSHGFIYYVSVTGVTGTRKQLPSDLIACLKLVKKYTNKPVAVGFGVSTPDQVRFLAPHVDGIVVGSALIKVIERHIGDDKLIPAVGDFIFSLKQAIID